MPRTYGTTNSAPYASAPVVGLAGDTYYNTATKASYISDGTNWIPVASPSWPRGVLAQVTATTASPTQTGVGTTVWLTCPVLAMDGVRRVKISFYGGLAQGGAAGDLGGLRLYDGATQIAVAQFKAQGTGGPNQETISGVWQGVPGSGNHTYTLNVFLSSGTAMVIGAGTTAPGLILVEDIGT